MIVKTKKNAKLDKPVFKACKNCGETIKITKKYGRTRKFCNQKCSWQYVTKLRQNSEPPMWRCYGCGSMNQLTYKIKKIDEKLRFDNEPCPSCRKSRKETARESGEYRRI